MIDGGAGQQPTLRTQASQTSLEKSAPRGKVWIRRHNDDSKCDVIVSFGADEMILQLPDYSAAVKWAQMEAKSRRLTAEL